jgi:glucosamine-6-phosphate deaminase
MDPKKLYLWCSIPAEELQGHKDLKTPFRMVEDSAAMGRLMARELIEEVRSAARQNRECRAIIPCGPNCWYAPFTELVNKERVSLENLVVFHMDECLDWEGGLLAAGDPYNFRSFMERHFYGGIEKRLAVPADRRFFLRPSNVEDIRRKIWEKPLDITMGGWGQDGHIAYNQARRHPFSKITPEQLRNSSIRVQDNNLDTIIALGQRSFGAAYQFVPPMSVTLGVKECLSAKKVRVYSDTGTWKQTALRVALFSPPDTEYPLTLLQEHSDALITAIRDTARHPVSEHPEWEFRGINV